MDVLLASFFALPLLRCPSKVQVRFGGMTILEVLQFF